MEKIAHAILSDGRRLPYVIRDNPPRGGMKHTYFSPDNTYVVQFFNDPAVGRDPNLRKRLEAIIGKYNPTLSEAEGGAQGNTPQMAAYFARQFCWPTAIVEQPQPGIVCPAYPQNFFFTDRSSRPEYGEISLAGKDKRSKWFTAAQLRRYLSDEEVGDFRAMLRLSLSLARSIRRMHQAGLAHSDLSPNNVLVDPATGACVIIDIDSLVVPGLYPPEVLGTGGYMAPEILATSHLPFGDPGRQLPCVTTDLHALGVLLYEYLLMRHPLEGPRHYAPDPRLDHFLAMGPKALFIEHPADQSNRPKDLPLTIHDLGPHLEKLFIRVFVEGLHNPGERPAAMEWERALIRTLDLLHPCENPDCAAGWFILHDFSRPVCPFCGHAIPRDHLLRLHAMRPIRGKAGQWTEEREIVCYPKMPLFPWHARANTFPDEKTEGHLQSYVCRHQGKWLIVNYDSPGMQAPNGAPVPKGRALILRESASFRLVGGEDGLLLRAEMG
ncbi:MAG: kinase [Clostridiales bacterium]|nr:kinase [Clostridiales bacterium]